MSMGFSITVSLAKPITTIGLERGKLTKMCSVIT